MKKIIFTLCVLVLAAGGCSKYDDSALWDEVNRQAERIAALEAWQATVNGNITALQGLVNALQNNRSITNVSAFSSPAPGGYTITFNSGAPNTIVIMNGTNGTNGEKGDKGDTGEKGESGQDGTTPQIGVAQYPESSGVYYWTLNGGWLLDDSQNKIPVTGPKGDPGEQGEQGAPGITPQLRINATTNEWEVCANGDCSDDADWTSLGVQATGAQGEKGEQGDAIFAPNGVKFYDDDTYDYVEFTLADGETTIKVPKYKAIGIVFEQPDWFAPGETQSVPYTLTGDVQHVKAVDVPQNWSVKVTRNGAAGTFTITSSATYSSSSGGEAVILVSAGDDRTIMRILRLSPSFAASTQTWTVGDQVWSDAIHVPECNQSSFISSNTEPYCRSYTSGTSTWYYYNWPYVNSRADQLCPSPWRVPTAEDFCTLDKSLTGAVACETRTLSTTRVNELYVQQWGGVFGGYAYSTSVYYTGSWAEYWSSTAYNGVYAYFLDVRTDGVVYPQTTTHKYDGFQVRCVK